MPGKCLPGSSAGMIPNLKVDVLEPVLCKGKLGEPTFQALDKLAASIAGRHQENGFAVS